MAMTHIHTRTQHQKTEREQTDGQTDATDCFTFPANAVGINFKTLKRRADSRLSCKCHRKAALSLSGCEWAGDVDTREKVDLRQTANDRRFLSRWFTATWQPSRCVDRDGWWKTLAVNKRTAAGYSVPKKWPRAWIQRKSLAADPNCGQWVLAWTSAEAHTPHCS